ncbi:MAG: glycosyltransferase [Hydrogenothermaceae bacterium]|nr:glycosyltransferase [Hydrogenothermaceae bacterium]
MIKVDLHLHSKASNKPGGYLSQKLGLSESYVEPRKLYQTLKSRGMTLFTITDHDTIDGCLEIADLPNTFISEEITTYFPEDKTKVHVIAIDINEKHHREFQYLRENIYDLVDYMQQNSVIHILAHPLYDMDGKLNKKHIEKFLLLFDNWEVINGTRSRLSSELTSKIAQHYSRDEIEILANKYGFIKRRRDFIAFTGGSDDHGGLDVGTTYTQCEGSTVMDLKNALLSGFISAEGLHGDPKRLSHMILNISREGLKNKVDFGNFGAILESLFEDKSRQSSILDSVFGKSQITGFINNVLNLDGDNPRDKHDRLFGFFKNLIPYFIKNHNGKRFSIENISSFIEKGFVSIIPNLIYASVYTQRAREKHRSLQLYQDLMGDIEIHNQKVAYFTDTFFEINGVAITTSKLLNVSKKYDVDMEFIISSHKDVNSQKVKNFKPVISTPLPEYPDITVNVPNFLEVLDYIEKQNFTTIYCATPGILGIYGLIISKILNITLVSAYHTDFPAYAQKYTGEPFIKLLADMYMKFFYSFSDRVLVPSMEYKNKLKMLGIREEKLEVFRRGVNLDKFNPKHRDRNFWKVYHPTYNGEKVVLYVGRIAKEKDVDIFLEVARLCSKKDVKFAIVGDGPYRKEIEKELPNNVILTGFLRDEALSKAYASADIFLFPSTTETFGNVVLEALASGLVCLVPDKGASKEFIIEDVNGYVIPDNNPIDYKIKIDILLGNPDILQRMKKNSLQYVKNYEEEELLLEMIKKIQLQDLKEVLT